MDDAKATSEGSFENTVKQLRMLNPVVKLKTSSMGVNYYVAASKILVPNYLEELVAQPVGGLP